MDESGDLPIDDPLSALLDSYAVAANDIESQVMGQLAAENDRDSLRADLAALRADVAALRAETTEIKQILLAARGGGDTRGDRLLPYATREMAPILLG